MADTPIEESNLAFIGSDEDKAAREAAAKLEFQWEGAGQEVGIQVWRVENKHSDDGSPHFGIAAWDGAMGEFYCGDSYIVLQTQKNGDGNFEWNVFFWIGSESSQDEYGVAAYKANELDDLLGDAPIQFRETEGHESDAFMACFPDGVRYLKGGIESGFRQVGADTGTIQNICRLFHVRKSSGQRSARAHLTKLACASLNQGDAFVLDAVETVYTWYGSGCSPFEKQKAITVANSIVFARQGHATLVQDVGDDVEEFWSVLEGSLDDIADASSIEDEDYTKRAPVMFVLIDNDTQLDVKRVEASPENLDTEGVCMIDDRAKTVHMWIGLGASKRERQQAMWIVQNHLKALGREKTTSVVRVFEGKEKRCPSWSSVFA